MAALKKLGSIPSLTHLYRTGQVLASSRSDLPTGKQELNDKICTIQYDITKLEVDAIVNAANTRLLGGGGVDGAIHRAAGPRLLTECRALGGCATGSAKITDAYSLPCKKIIHAVGPVYSTRQESEPLLRGCYRTALELASQNDCKSIAFSAISTGIYGYPSDEAAATALGEVKKFLDGENGWKIQKVVFCNFMQKDVDAYSTYMPVVFPATEDDKTKKVEDPRYSNYLSQSQMPAASSEKTPLTVIPEPTKTVWAQIAVVGVEAKAGSTGDANQIQSGRDDAIQWSGEATEDGTTINVRGFTTDRGDDIQAIPQAMHTVFRSNDSPSSFSSRLNISADEKKESANQSKFSLQALPVQGAPDTQSEADEYPDPSQPSEIMIKPTAIEAKVRQDLRITRETFLSTLADAQQSCTRLAEKCDEMEETVRELNEKVAEMETQEREK